MKFAIIQGGSVVNVAAASEEFAAQQGWIACPDGVSPGWTYAGGDFTPPPASAAYVPPSITNFQFRKALRNSSKAAAFKTYYSGLTEAEQEEWLFMPLIYRDSAMVAAAATALSVTNNQLDTLFRNAANL